MLMQQEWTTYKRVSQNLLLLLYLKKKKKKPNHQTLKKTIKKLKERKPGDIFLTVTFPQ